MEAGQRYSIKITTLINEQRERLCRYLGILAILSLINVVSIAVNAKC